MKNMLKKARDLILAASAVLACGTLSAAAPATTNATPSAQVNANKPTAQTSDISKDDLTKASAAFGHFIGRNLKTPAVEFDIDAIIQGLRDGAAGKPAPMTDKEYEQLMSRIQTHAIQAISKDNLNKANEFLTKNANEAGIIVIEPGKLQYKIIKEGSGPTVQPHNSPKINYHGEFLDGTEFGSSEEAGGSVTIPLDQTIQGFNLGIAGMKEGEKRRLFVHPDLGYGTSGHLPPNSLLIFDIEVVKADNAGQHNTDSDDDSSDSDSDSSDDFSPLSPGDKGTNQK